MYRRNISCSSGFGRLSDIHPCVFGSKDCVPINQNPSQDFNINPDTGRPLSQIQALVRSQIAAEQMAMFAELDDFKSKYLPEGMSDKEALKFMCPRWCQLPSQLADFQSYIIAQRDIAAKKVADDAAAAEAAKQVDEVAVVETPVVESKSE